MTAKWINARCQMTTQQPCTTEGSDEADELTKFEPEGDGGMMAECAAKNASGVRQGIHATLKYAALFHAGVDEPRNVEEVEEYTKISSSLCKGKQNDETRRGSIKIFNSEDAAALDSARGTSGCRFV